MRLSVGFITIPMLELDPDIVISSPCFNSNLVPPSRETQAEFLLSIGFLIVNLVETGSIRGLKLNECGAKGVKQKH